MAKKIDLTGLDHFKEEENESIAYIESSSTASKAHKVGERFYFKGKLVICTVDIASGGTITLNTNCKLDVLGDDVTAQSEQIDYTKESIIAETIPYAANGSSGSNLKATQDGNILTLNGASTATASQATTKIQICGVVNVWNNTATPDIAKVFPLNLISGHKYRLSATVKSGTKSAGEGNGNIHFRLVASGDVVKATTTMAIADNTTSVEYTSDGTPVTVRVYCARLIQCSNLKIEIIIQDVTVDSKLDSMYAESINFVETFGSDNYPLGWTTGYYNSTGSPGSDANHLRTPPGSAGGYYIAVDGAESLTLTAPTGYHACIVEYDAKGENGTRHGNPDNGANSITISLTTGHKYRFCIGEFNGDASDYLTEEFLSTVTATVQRSFLSWKTEQDEKMNYLFGNSIPEYFTANGYLQNKLNTITTIQKSLSDKNDAFIFISDYHVRTNRGNSLALIKEIVSKTGMQKIFFSGDAGGRIGGDTGDVVSMQRSAMVWSKLANCAEDFYGALGNHEWIDGNVYGKGAMFGNYLNRFKQRVPEMSANGSYYIEDQVCKVRYYFIQDSYGASALDYDWLE